MNSAWRLWLLLVAAGALLGAACSSGDDSSTATNPPTTRVAATTTSTTPPVYSAAVVEENQVDPAYRQGVARVDDGWIFSLNDGLFRTDNTLVQTVKLTPAIPAEWAAKGYNHIGDIDVVGDTLYAPLEQPNYELGTQAMLLYDATTLTYKSGLEVAQHEDSFVTVDPDTGIAYSMDRFGGQTLLRYDTKHDWKLLDPLPMSSNVDKVQGADVVDGAVWLSTDDATDGVYRVDLKSGDVQSLGSIGHVDGEGEGIDATPLPSGDLHVLSIDVAVVPVRLIDLKVTRQ
jgi:hypothetical protein